jgi:cytochrome c biogenesis protein CcmG/thiol:disulfide interchange protein DsbE
MFVRTGVVLLAAVAAVLGCGANNDSGSARASAASSGQAKAGPAPGKAGVFPPAADYLVRDHRGRQVDLRDYQGKIVVLNFWATWCPPCRYEIPHLVRLRAAYDEKEVAILGVSIDRGPDEQVRPLLSRFVDEYDINYPVLLDGELRLLRQFLRRDLAAAGVPMTYVIDRKGQLFSTHEGLPLTRSGQPDPGGVLDGEIRQLLDRDK